MTGQLPARRISREALERIIQRAAELQAGELDTGEGLTEQELLKLGAEVGIDGRFLRQALYEEAAGAPADEKGFVAKWIGPGAVSASRVVSGDPPSIEQALEHWMREGEALAIKRRMPDRTVWERQRGFLAEMKRGFGVGGKRYELAKAHDVSVAVTALEPGYGHVEMVANLDPTRRGYASGGGLIAAGGVLAGGIVFGYAGLLLLSAVLAGAGGGVGWLVARGYRRAAEQMQLALEQVLDRLERGEIKPRHQIEPAPLFPLGRIVSEIRRAVSEVSAEAPRRRHLRPPR